MRDLLRVLQPSHIHADRPEPELAAAPLLELLEQPLERRAPVAGLALRLARQPSRAGSFVVHACAATAQGSSSGPVIGHAPINRVPDYPG